MHAIAEVPLAEELGTEAHDFEALFRDAGSGVFRSRRQWRIVGCIIAGL